MRGALLPGDMYLRYRMLRGTTIMSAFPTRRWKTRRSIADTPKVLGTPPWETVLLP